MPQARNLRGNVLQLEGEVRWHDGAGRSEAQGAGAGEQQAQEAVGRVDAGQGVSADVILTHRVGVNLTHLGDDGGLLAADNVDSGASSGDQGNGASWRQHSGDGQAAGLLTQHDQAVSA
ncbi:putative transposase [Bordetella holmesii ATCC 51541]|nr:putative transposase [Bordetella holmesii ATCC 51541]